MNIVGAEEDRNSSLKVWEGLGREFWNALVIMTYFDTIYGRGVMGAGSGDIEWKGKSLKKGKKEE